MLRVFSLLFFFVVVVVDVNVDEIHEIDEPLTVFVSVSKLDDSVKRIEV